MSRTNSDLSTEEILAVEELNEIPNNSVIYKNNSWTYEEVPLWTDAQVLTSNWPTVAPTFEDAWGGGGGFTKLWEATLWANATSFDVALSWVKKNLYVVVRSKWITSNWQIAFRFNDDSWSNYTFNRTVDGTNTGPTVTTNYQFNWSHTEPWYVTANIVNDWVNPTMIQWRSILDHTSFFENEITWGKWNNIAQITKITVIAPSRILIAWCTIEVYWQD